MKLSEQLAREAQEEAREAWSVRGERNPRLEEKEET